MLRSITVEAPAKINLGLAVLPRRPDGYHNISSVFRTVGLRDTITVEPAAGTDACIVECEGMELPQENTFTQAYRAFCVLTGVTEGVRVRVRKRIPSGGGLGGGSSDCASFLLSIDTLFGTRLPASALLSVAGKVGSDVFFFVHALLAERDARADGHTGFAALVEGRGENVTQITGGSDYVVLLVFPGVFVSTREAYGLVDGANALKKDISVSGHRLVEMYKKPIREWFFSNDFTSPVTRRHPEIAQALAEVKGSGADFADMSGSGSTVFGIFEDRIKARSAADALAGKWSVVLA